MLTASTIDFTPPALLDSKAHADAKITLRDPTMADKDVMGVLIYRMNIRPVSQDHIRAMMIHELYEMFDEEEASEKAVFLEQHWIQSEREEMEFARWQEQEMQRLADIGDLPKGVEVPKQQPMPERTIHPRQRSQVSLLTQRILDGSEAVRNLLADQNLYDIRWRDATVRLHVVGWSGLDATPEFEERYGESMLTDASLEQLRRAMPGRAYQQLAARIEQLYGVTEEERKNSGSPPSNTTPPDGSSGSEEEGSAGSDGSSTSSNTGRAPSGGSPKKTGTSSKRTRGSAGGPMKHSPTADR